MSIKVEICPQCGSTVKLNSSICEYCEAEFIVTSLSYLDKFDKTGINKYISQYKEQLKSNPEDEELNLSMGICYLNLGLYDLTDKFFLKAIELMPENADVYYYYALSLFKGRKPKVLLANEMKKIEEYLKTAVQLDDSKPHYYYLLILIKYDYYMKNGLLVKPPSIEELLDEVNLKKHNEIEINNLLKRVPVSDNEIINKIRQNI